MRFRAAKPQVLYRFRYHVLTLSTLYFVVVRGCKQGRHIVAPSRARAGRRDGKHSLPAVCLPPCSSAPDALSGPRQKILFAALLRRDGYPALLSRCSCLSLQVPLAATSGCRHSTDMILRPPNHHPSAEAISEAVGRLRRPCILCAKILYRCFSSIRSRRTETEFRRRAANGGGG